MKYLFFFIISCIALVFRVIGALFIIIWNFKINPILERGTKGGYFYEPWDYRLYDWLFYGVKPQYRGIS